MYQWNAGGCDEAPEGGGPASGRFALDREGN